MISELTSVKVPVKVVTDNRSLVESVYSTKIPQYKRLRIKISALRSMVENSEVSEVISESGTLLLADCLTKSSKISCEKLLKIIHDDY